MNTIKLNTIGTPCKAGGNAGGGNSGGGGGSTGIAPTIITPNEAGNGSKGCIDFYAKKVFYYDETEGVVVEDDSSLFEDNKVVLSKNGLRALFFAGSFGGTSVYVSIISPYYTHRGTIVTMEDGTEREAPAGGGIPGAWAISFMSGGIKSRSFIDSPDGKSFIVECNIPYSELE